MQFASLAKGSLMHRKFARLTEAMNRAVEILKSVGATPEQPLINLSAQRAEIGFVFDNRRWLLTLKEQEPKKH